MTNVRFLIGSCQHSDMWVENDRVGIAINNLLDIYGPLLERQNYCITLFSRNDNILSNDASKG